MEAGPRESDGRTDGIPGSRLDGDPLPSLPPSDAASAQPGHPGELPELAQVAAVDEAADGAASAEEAEHEADESYAELRPSPRLRLMQLVPITLLSLLGSLMFAFPLAFAFDEAGAVVAMLGLLIGCSAAGWGMMAARRVGYTWPGLPARGSGHRPDWRLLALYAAGLAILVALAVWRVAALR